MSTTTEPTPTTTTVAGPTTTTTIPPKVTTTPVTNAGGASVGTITAVEGTGNATVMLPASARPTAIVHAQYRGTGAFIVSSVTAQGEHIAVLAQSLGAYEGTFAVGFVDARGKPTAGLSVRATGAWHLDIADPKLAPSLTGSGVSGHGDTVLAYTGPAVNAHVVAASASPLVIAAYTGGEYTELVRTVGPFDGKVGLPAGPAFISVTATGDWSMSLG